MNTLIELGYKERVLKLLSEEQFYTDIARRLKNEDNVPLSFRTLREQVSQIHRSVDTEMDIINEGLAIKVQKLQDQQRIDRRTFREDARILGGLDDYHEALTLFLKQHNLKDVFPKTPFSKNAEQSVGIFHFTDAHFNEIIELVDNNYDFTIASARLKLFVNRAIHYFKAEGVEKVLFACTGDIINSDRRLDELLNAAVNRAKATFIAVDLIKQALFELNQYWPIDVAFVTGNESRMTEHIHWSEFLVTDNYDFNIFNILKEVLKDVKGINFIVGDPLELIVSVLGHNILLIHGHQNGLNKANITQKDIQSIMGKYTQKNLEINFVLFGHIHSAYVSDFFARGSSLSGGNSYSDKALQFASRASQNIHIVRPNAIDSIKIDLQHTTQEGYQTDLTEVKKARPRETKIVHNI
jgi:predicted phosphodiesterase